jgi:hypothetical protein
MVFCGLKSTLVQKEKQTKKQPLPPVVQVAAVTTGLRLVCPGLLNGLVFVDMVCLYIGNLLLTN